MPYKIEQSQRIVRLQRSLDAKLRALQSLEQEREELHLRHILLSSTCEVLSLLRRRKAAIYGTAAADQQSHLATDEELQHLSLLQQLRGISNVDDSPWPSPRLQTDLLHTLSRSSNSSADTHTRDGSIRSSHNTFTASDGSLCAGLNLNSTIASSDDPLQLLRGLVAVPCSGHGLGCGLFGLDPVPHPAVITVQELQSYYHNSMNQLATHVAFLEQAHVFQDLSGRFSSSSSTAVMSAAVAQHAEAVQQIMFRYLRLINDIVMHNNAHMLVSFYVTNVVTGVPLEHKTDMYLQSLQQLHLTPQQQDRIIACWNFYVKLYCSVTSQRAKMQQQGATQQQQQQQGTAGDDQAPKSSSNGGSSSSSKDGNTTDPRDQASGPFEVQKSVQLQQQHSWQQQEQRQQYLQSLDVNMGKELMIVHLAAFTFWGTLSWMQAAKLVMTCYPFPANPNVLASVLSELRQQSADAAMQQHHHQQGGTFGQQPQRKGRGKSTKRHK